MSNWFKFLTDKLAATTVEINFTSEASENGIASLLSVAYLMLSLPVFLKVYDTSREIIDEEFHLRQGKHFCHGSYGIWDDKITTFPGLYILTSLLLPKKACTVFYMRALSLIFSSINVFIIYKIRAMCSRNKSAFSLAFESISLAILPPLYFFAHLYYTDVISLSTVLALYYFWIKGSHGKAAICGFCCILMRQTNIVWVGMIFGINILKMLSELCDKEKRRKIKMKKNNLKHILMNFYNVCTNFKLLQRYIICVLQELWGYIVLICGFVIFVLYNGSIVVGDKSAHTAVLHLPQLFYFSLFSLLFGVGFVLPKTTETISYMRRYWRYMVILAILGIVVIHYNTLVHPYLLADNRHYTFYVWNRFYSKPLFRYIMIPIYMFGLVCIQIYLKSIATEFQIMFYISLFIVLCFQRLLEIRYFIIPYVIIKLNVNLKIQYLVLEIAYYMLINLLVFNIFFNKEIYWSDRHDVQRLLW